MKKRTYSILVVLFALLLVAVNSIYALANDSEIVNAVTSQSRYTLDVEKSRGMIYDCNMQPLVNAETGYMAAVAPTIDNISYLIRKLGEEYRPVLTSYLNEGKPFVIETDRMYQYEGIETFKIKVRYSDNQPAEHLIGYIDSEGDGVTGIERSFNDILRGEGGEISIDYRVDAVGRAIIGDEIVVKDTTVDSDAGVVLTIDSLIQQCAENAAEKLGAGAVVVTEVPNCEIRAMVSTPGYSPLDLESASVMENSPFINRCLREYTPGSVFKLVAAAAELENKSSGHEYECTGSISVSGMDFSCYGGYPHGKVTLETAVSKSCNCYFINSVRAMGGESVLAMAYNLGLGNDIEFSKDFEMAGGNLPLITDLSNNRALANFSFGQGDITATPVQIAALVNAIASNGVYTEPKVVSGIVDDNYRYISGDGSLQNIKTRVMEASVARTLQDYMVKASEEGTAVTGKPDGITSGAKTGTAQTGIFVDDEELNHFWYSGFISDDDGPRYCITVLCESVVTDDGAAAEVFKEISEYINKTVF